MLVSFLSLLVYHEWNFNFQQMDLIFSIENLIDIESDKDLKLLYTHISFIDIYMDHIFPIKTNFIVIH